MVLLTFFWVESKEEGRGGVQHTWLTQTTGVEVPEIMAETPDVILGMS